MILPDSAACSRILSECGTPERVVRHCAAVAEYARSLVKRLNAAGCDLDLELLHAAALLHDCRRSQPNHAEAAAAYLAALGYGELAKLVAVYHDLKEPIRLDEAAILYYADKRVQQDRLVTLKERFAASLPNCAGEQAKAAHERRHRAALAVERLIEQALGTKDF